MTDQPAGAIVGDLMHLDPIVIRVDASLIEAARLLDKHRIGGVPVVDAEGYLCGVLSQTDLLRARATEHLWANWPGLVVRHLMTSPAITVRPSFPVAAAARLMERERVHRLVVIREDDERIPVGILSTGDLVHAMTVVRTDD